MTDEMIARKFPPVRVYIDSSELDRLESAIDRTMVRSSAVRTSPGAWTRDRQCQRQFSARTIAEPKGR